jgi:putative ABC transport system substrate-binding protein
LLAAELVNEKVEIIVSGGPAVTRVVQHSIATIPIVMAFDDDPVGNKFVASLARPAGNITGLSSLNPEISGKQLELLKETIPKTTRVAVFWNSSQPGNGQALKEIEHVGDSLGVKLKAVDMRTLKDLESVFRDVMKEHADAALALPSPALFAQRTKFAEIVAKSRLPTMYAQSDYIDVGGLMFYGASVTDLYRRAATYVDKILKGAKPADLPVEQPTKFELVINLKAAKQIGLTIPPNVLARADRVIK